MFGYLQSDASGEYRWISIIHAPLRNLTRISLFALPLSAYPFRNLQDNSFLVDKENAALLRRFTRISSLLIDTKDVCIDKAPPAIDIQLGPIKLYIPTSRRYGDAITLRMKDVAAAFKAKFISYLPDDSLDCRSAPFDAMTMAGKLGRGLVCNRGDSGT